MNSIAGASPSSKTAGRALTNARSLAAMGVPVFAARLTEDGQPDRTDKRWLRWQAKKPSARAIDAWEPGDALCAVTGVVFDVLDVDPRNGGDESFATLASSLGDDGPFKFWEVKTPRGGSHIWVARMGIGKHTGFMPGLDLQGGKPDGSGRGFVFLPPTYRNGGAYKPCALLRPWEGGDGSVGPLRSFIEERLDAGNGNGQSADGTSGRSEPSSLKRAVLAAGAGEQRGALLRLVHEMERRGYERDDIKAVLRDLLPTVRNFDGKDPWYPARGGNPDKHINGLFHRSGAVSADGTEEELEGIGEPIRPGLMRSFADIPRRKTEWLWKGYLARGEMTILDGEKGVFKSGLTLEVGARLSTGRPLPGMDEATGEALHVAIFTAEASAETEIGPRLDAAGAKVEYIHCPKITKTRRGKAQEEWILPDGWQKFANGIREVGASLAIWDPINDFLEEKISTNNDASIRRALMPLGRLLQDLGCAGWLIRHMNKDTGASARMRGAGTTAYQNRARVHLVAGRLPPGSVENARFGLAIVDSNLRKVEEGCIAYDVVDSDIPADDADGMVPMIDWFGICKVSADELVKGAEGARKGPVPIAQEEIAEVLQGLFDLQDTWPAKKVQAELRAAGCSSDKTTIAKVKANLGIRSVRRGAKRGSGGVESWDWTILTTKGKVRSDVHDDE